MKWEIYATKLKELALKEGKTKEFIISCLDYAGALYKNNLPIIYDSYHLSRLLGYELEYIYSMSHAPHYYYRTFKIEKKNGGMRELSEPLPDLKCIQTWILREILCNIPISPYAKAYVPGRSIKDNARFHRKQPCLLTLDVCDFFGSIHFGSVRRAFIQMGYQKKLATVLANLCCLRGALPQGAPTSPYLSNIVMLDIDERLGAIARERNWRYTRYADDISFSGNIEIPFLFKNVRSILGQMNLKINASKTRIAKPNARQIVTGIVVNEKMQIPKTKRKFIRQQVYYIKKFGIDSHLVYHNETRKNYLNHIMGLINQACYVNPKDVELSRYRDFIVSIVHEKY